MANPTYNLIASQVVGSGGASSVVFGSGGTIPQTYTDLKLVASARTNRGTYSTDAIWIELNGSTTGYAGKMFLNANNSVASYSSTYPLENYAGADDSLNTANTFGNIEWYIPNYTSSNYKSASSDGVVENNNVADVQLGFASSLWSNTAAITSITLVPGYGTSFVQYSTFYLYGIKNS